MQASGNVPICGSSTEAKPAVDEIPAFDLRATIAEIEHHGRRILEIARMAEDIPLASS
jgi:hypothetical protein